MLNLSVHGTVAFGKDRLLEYQKNIIKKYQQLRVEENSILFHSGKDVCRYHVTLFLIQRELSLFARLHLILLAKRRILV